MTGNKSVWTYLGYLGACGLEARQVAHDRDEVDVAHASEELEAFGDKVHEELEPGVLQGEADAHDDGTDDVADGGGKHGGEVGGLTAALNQAAQKQVHFFLRGRDRQGYQLSQSTDQWKSWNYNLSRNYGVEETMKDQSLVE